MTIILTNRTFIIESEVIEPKELKKEENKVVEEVKRERKYFIPKFYI